MNSISEWRKNNMLNTILHLIRSEGKASKHQLQKATHYSLSSVLAAIDELSAANLITSAGKGESNGGRRPEHFVLNPEGGYFIGLEYNVHAISGAVIDFCGVPTDTRRVSLEREQLTPDRLTQAIFDMVEDLLTPLRAAGSQCFGIGIGEPSLIGFRSGAALTYNDPTDPQYIPIQWTLEKRFGLPVHMDHNVNTIALAYKVLDEEHQDGDFVLFSIRKGIRVSSIINGKMLRGRNNAAGEAGHIPVPGNDRLCVCGRRGCLDTLVSNDGITQRLQEGVRDGRFKELYSLVGEDPARLDAVSLVDSILVGHAESLAFLEEICDTLAYALAQIVNFLNPPKVIVYGELTRIGEPFMNALRERLGQMAFQTSARNLQLIPARLNYSISAIGAAALVMTRQFPYVPIVADTIPPQAT